MNPIEEYYCKFNEDKRFDSRHGQVEFMITMKYIDELLGSMLFKGRDKSDIKILDVGAGTGRYSIHYANEGYDVSALELVKHNLSRLKAKCPLVHARQGDGRNLSKYPDDNFDITLIFGPLYHLFNHEDKLKCLTEARRVTKPGGYILAAYVMNDYGIITYGIKEGHLKESIDNGRVDEAYNIHSDIEDLYDYVRLEEIDRLREDSGLERVRIITPDGPTNYIRPQLKAMTDEEFEIYLDYVYSISSRADMIGAAAHTVDILKKI